MRKLLCSMIIAVAACSASVHESTLGVARLPADAPRIVVARNVQGRVMDSEHAPLAGALISVIDLASFRGVGFAASDSRGEFSVGIPSKGAVVTVMARGHVAGAFEPPSGSAQGSIVLARPSAASRTFSGVVVDGKGRPLDGVRVRLMNWKWPVGTAYYALTDHVGHFEFIVDRGEDDSFDLLVDDPSYVSGFGLVPPGDRNIVLTVYERLWIETVAGHFDEAALRTSCIPLDAGGVKSLATSLISARVVGLGESTHGTREYTVIRGGILDALARDGWLTTIALEASWADVAHLDAYVRQGKGTARDAVASVQSWPWRIEEMIAVVESIRRFNDTQPEERKIEFVGIDYAVPAASIKLIDRYFASRRSEYGDELAKVELLRGPSRWGVVSEIPAGERHEIAKALVRLEKVADDELPSGLLAAQALQMTKQLVETPELDARDTMMAESVLALLARPDKQRHIAIWAHNGHVALGPIEGAVPMGDYLRVRLKDDYRAIGTLFYEGSFLTYSQDGRMVTHTVSLPPPHYLEAAIHRVSPDQSCVLDVAGAKDPSVRSWLAVPKVVRFYGGLEISEGYPWPPVLLPDLWSTIIYVPVSTSTSPLQRPE
ncbi:MAG: erythromycin esterase family protein [Deltaproteobacteria bacterium]|nr:erythromycin esterase family protein [Deltaproteobacteria bacterium]